MRIRGALLFLAALGVGLCFSVACRAAAAPTPAVHASVEVVEYFWYGCPHCYRLEPGLEDLLRHRGTQIHFRRVPLNVSFLMRAHQRMFYTLSLLGREQELTPIAQKAIATKQSLLLTESGQAEFFAAYGIRDSDYRKTYESAAVSAACAAADREAREANVEHVPTLVVDGKYVASPERVVLAARAAGQRDPNEDDAMRQTLANADGFVTHELSRTEK
jgi:thiol:disulfide interchange protein DsbA